MKRTFIALVALIIAGASIFLACSKDGEETQSANIEKNLSNNPFESLGQEHNAILTELGLSMQNELDNCAMSINNGTFTDDDANQLIALTQNKLRKTAFNHYQTNFMDEEWSLVTNQINYTLSD